jgi:superfamily II DNA/RNA helicase
MQIEAKEAILNNPEVVLLSPTGTGKTLAFLLPLIEQLDPSCKNIQALIIVPSRELAIQIEQVLREMGTGYKTNALYGGRAGSKDKIDLQHPPAILIGTPGRIASHLFRESFNIQDLTTLVLDEFDKSLEIGFDDEMIEIIESLPNLNKKVLTSATFGVDIPDFVELKDPVEINYLKDKKSNLAIEIVVSPSKNKLETLQDLLSHVEGEPGIVFCNYKDSIQEVSDFLKVNQISHDTFHGGMEQKDRERALIKFRNGTHQILLATDLASRGIDIPDLKFIIHYQLPHREEEFTHRNGRTARMHSEGTAFVLKSKEEKLPDFIHDVAPLRLKRNKLQIGTGWSTLFVSGGRKDKISKGDIAGLFLKQGGVSNEDLGIIELKLDCAFVGIKTAVAKTAIDQTTNTKLKKKKVRVSLI